MNASSPAAKWGDFFRRAFLFFEREAGQSLLFWAMVALLGFVAQIIFRRTLAPGEFGTMNTLLGVTGLMTVPLFALQQSFGFYLAQPHPAERRKFIDALGNAGFRVLPVCALVWGGISLMLLFAIVQPFAPLRFSIQLFTLLIVLVSLGGVVGGAICQEKKTMRFLGWLLFAAALARILAGIVLVRWAPWTEAGLAASLFAGFIVLTPVLREPEIKLATLKEWRAVYDRDFLIWLGATLSVLTGLFLFSSADRIIAQGWFGTPDNNNMGYVNWSVLDDYQTAGLLGRGLFWSVQPLLLIFFMQRLRLDKTTSASLKYFWIYLGILGGGAVLLALLGRPLAWLFCGVDSPGTYGLVPAFAIAMALLGLLQGVGMFALASRRYPECFVLGGSSLAYVLLLSLAGRQPVLMLAYMFGGGLVALLMVLFIGVVRWGRKQP